MKLLLLVCIIALTEGRRPPTLWKLEKPCWNEKKCRNCDGRCVKEEKVQCLRDPCEDSPCGDEEMCVANYCGECSACCLEPKECNKQSRVCEDGSEVFRDPFNNCRFPECPEPVICTTDVFECADGTYLSRGGPNCEFPECPVKIPACAPKGTTLYHDAKTCQIVNFFCEEGFEHWSNPFCGCGCKPKAVVEEGCPKGQCADCDGKCIDQVFCIHNPCLTDNGGCAADEECVGSCGCFKCGCKKRVCTEDAFICPDGTSLSRDPANNCEFPKCPVPACAPEGATFMGDHKTCMVIDFVCEDGFEHWNDVKCGCGCKPKKEVCPKGQCADCEGKCVDQVFCIHNPCLTDNGGCAADEECVGSCGCFKCGCKKRVCTKDAFICPDGTSLSRDPANNCEFPECPTRVCTQEVKTCPDGSFVSRDSKNGCAFPECPPVPACVPKGYTFKGVPEICKRMKYACPKGMVHWSDEKCGCGCKPEPVICTTDVFECADGTYLSRGGPNCEFPECPVKIPACAPKGTTAFFAPKTCQIINFFCEEGFEYWGNPDCGCGCKPKAVVEEGCPEGQCADCEGKCIDQVFCIHNPCLTDNGGCAADEECVGSCACFKCGCKKRVCTEDAFICPDGTSLSRDPANKCEFPECPTRVCTQEVKTCPDGSFVSRDSKNGCAFPECPTRVCTQEVKTCPDGSFVSRDSTRGCTFPECPVPKCVSKGHTFVGTPESDKCQTRKYNCDIGMERWSDAECGCGCRPNSCPDGECMGCDGKCAPRIFCKANPCSLPTGMCANPDEECVTDGCGCTKCGCEKRVCDKTTHICPDGTLINRDPTNNCEYPKCPSPVCPLDAKLCPNGKYVSRNPKNNCEFDPCVGDACTGCNKWLKCASLDCPKAPGSCFGCCQKCVIGNDGTCTGVTPVEACPVNTH